MTELKNNYRDLDYTVGLRLNADEYTRIKAAVAHVAANVRRPILSHRTKPRACGSQLFDNMTPDISSGAGDEDAIHQPGSLSRGR